MGPKAKAKAAAAGEEEEEDAAVAGEEDEEDPFAGGGGEEDGDDAFVEAATSTLSFIPPLQWPGFPQAKSRLPVSVKLTTSLRVNPALRLQLV